MLLVVVVAFVEGCDAVVRSFDTTLDVLLAPLLVVALVTAMVWLGPAD